MYCINCGKPSQGSILCTRCRTASNQTMKELRKGIDLEYRDGSKKRVKLPQ